MKIEKKKVTGNSCLSNATKAGVASLLGMSAVLMSGCLGEAESGQVVGPVEPDNNNPNSSDASVVQKIQSSSSVVDIPLSQERLSSEAIEALSSSSVQTPSSSSTPTISSSETARTPESSSSEKAVSSSSESSSSTFVEKPLSSSSDTVVPPWVGPGRNCNYIDSMGVNVIMCHDDDDFPLVSMVSTYEMFDNA